MSTDGELLEDYHELDEFDREIARLVDLGVMWPDSVGPNGEFNYKFDLDRLQVESPMLYEYHMNRVQDTLDKLVNAGLADVEFDDDLNVYYKLADGVDISQLDGLE